MHFAKSFKRFADRQDLVRLSLFRQVVMQGHSPVSATALLRPSPTSLIDEDVVHCPGRCPEEVIAPFPRRLLTPEKLDIGLMQQRRRLQQVSHRQSSQLSTSDFTKFIPDNVQQLVRSTRSTVTDRLQKRSYCTPALRHHRLTKRIMNPLTVPDCDHNTQNVVF